jgi:hypothetical protein
VADAAQPMTIAMVVWFAYSSPLFCLGKHSWPLLSCTTVNRGFNRFALQVRLDPPGAQYLDQPKRT